MTLCISIEAVDLVIDRWDGNDCDGFFTTHAGRPYNELI